MTITFQGRRTMVDFSGMLEKSQPTNGWQK
jgi:hypothetical protein